MCSLHYQNTATVSKRVLQLNILFQVLLFVVLCFSFWLQASSLHILQKMKKKQQQQHYSPLSVKSSLLIILKVNQNHFCNFVLHFPSQQRPNKPSVKIILQEITVLSHLKNSILTMTYQVLECQKK